MNNFIATGHMMRCLSIADAIRDKGEEVCFITADDNGAKLLAERGYDNIVLGSKWDDLESELGKLVDIIGKYNVKSLLIDHYYVTGKYLSGLKKYTKIIYIDDLMKFPYPVDVLICYAAYADRAKYEMLYKDKADLPEFLLGMQYVPLRKCFQNVAKKDIKPDVKNMLIMSGGSDRYGVVKKILEELEIEQFQEINAICGIYNTDYDIMID